MNFVWRKEWIKAYETPWSIFEKLAFANRLERNDILRFFGNDDVKRIKNPNIGDSRRELIQLSGFNAALLNKVFESDLVGDCKHSVGTLIKPLNYFRERLNKWFPEHLHWCHDCLSHGYHSWFHQFILIKICPFHESILLDCCPKCGGRIPFLISDKGMCGVNRLIVFRIKQYGRGYRTLRSQIRSHNGFSCLSTRQLVF